MPSGCCNSTPDLPVEPKVGSLAPDFEVTTIDGETVTLGSLKGKPVLLLFWATWCGACKANIPNVQAAFEEMGDEVNFLTIALDTNQDTVQQYIDNKELGLPVAMNGNVNVTVSYYNESTSIYENVSMIITTTDYYGIVSIPTTFLIDSQGVIKKKRVGGYRDAADLLAALKELH